MPGPFSIREVAARAGVGKSTVSRVLTGDARVRASTRDRVEEVMREMGYRPNALARGLSSGRTQMIGLIVHGLHNPFFGLLAHGVEQTARRHGYNVLVATSDESVQQQQECLAVFAEQRVDGVLIVPVSDSRDELATMEQMHCPVVLLNSTSGNDLLSSVGVDDVRGGYLAASHLLSLGHRRISFIGPHPAGQWRLQGFRKAHAERGLAVDDCLVRNDVADVAIIQEAIVDLLSLPQPPTAICTINDETAIVVLQTLAQRQVRVPDDISLVGYDDLPVAARLDPPLTTVAQPLEQQSRLATELLVHLMTDGQTPVQRIVLPPRLVVRASCGAMRGAAVQP